MWSLVGVLGNFVTITMYMYSLNFHKISVFFVFIVFNLFIYYAFSKTERWNKLKQSLFLVHRGTSQREHLHLVYVLRPDFERTELMEQ